MNQIIWVMFYILHTNPGSKRIKLFFENKNSPLKVENEIYKLLQFLTTITETYHNHRKLANLITLTTVLSNSMKLNHSMWGHPKRMGHGGELRQNVVHWRRKWQTTLASLPWEPMNSIKRQKGRTLKGELHRPVGAHYATGDQWRNNSRMNKGIEPKQKQHSAVGETCGRRKVWCCKEQYYTGTWDVRSMYQGKLEVVKQEMTRVNVDILGSAT